MATTSKTRPSLEQILRILHEQLPDLRMRYSVRSLGVFGSLARGEAKKNSDLDVLIDFQEAPDLFQFIDLRQELGNLLGIKVDLVTRASLKGSIGKRILEEVVLV